MIPTPHTITVIPSHVVMVNGTPKRVPNEAAAFDSPAFVQPKVGQEDRDSGAVIIDGVAFVPSSTVVDAWTQVAWLGRRYELASEPLPSSSLAGAHHYRLELRRIR